MQNINNNTKNIQQKTISTKEGGIHTAVKLLNQYAEAYYLLENQFETLKKENKDLKSNLNINKEIIQSFFQSTTSEQKISNYVQKLKEENSTYSQKIKELESLILNLKSQKKYDSIYKDKYEQAKTKIFLLENLILEKDNEIKKYKQNKLNRKMPTKNNSYEILEVYISDPSKIANKLNDELEIFRELNNKANERVKTLCEALNKKDQRLKDYEAKMSKYMSEISQYKQEKTNSAIILQLNQYKQANNLNSISSNNINRSDNNIYTVNSNSNISNLNNVSRSNSNNLSELLSSHTNISVISKTKRTLMNQIERLEQVNSNKKKIIEKNFDLTQEWYEALKYCNMTQEEFIQSCSNPKLVKLTDIIEFLYKIIIDKNLQLKLVNEENDHLNLDNLKLNKNIIELSEQIDNLKFSMANNNSIIETSHNKINSSCCNDNSTFVNVNNSINNISNNINANVVMDYIKEVKQSVTSSEFQEGIAIDQFDFVSDIPKNL